MKTIVNSEFDCIIYQNGNRIGECKSGESFALNLEKGNHILSFENKEDNLTFPRKDFQTEVSINNFFETLLITVKIDGNNISVHSKYKESVSVDSKYYAAKTNMFSFKGRIRRLEYGITNIIIGVVVYFLELLAEETPFFIIFLIPFIWISFAQGAKRCHDVGMSGWWILLSYIPVVNIGFGLYLLFKRGESGYNQYGPNPKGE